MRFLVTGGAGFIGSALVRLLIRETEHEVLNIDKLTYAGDLANLAEAAASPRHRHVRADIVDAGAVQGLMAAFRPDVIVHLAAESHVDRSIDGPRPFIETNVVGTYILLEAARAHWRRLAGAAQARFRFHYVSTDEVFGPLGAEGRFDEASPFRPSSPYAATKAAGDHLAQAWHRTYGLPVVSSHASNTYGPHQYPDKLIPLLILNALQGRPLPIYGDGLHVRDWLHVEDHARALLLVATLGRAGESYGIGGGAERRNGDVARRICCLLDELRPASPHVPHRDLIASVPDRPGHDRRYALNPGKLRRELGWAPRHDFEAGLRATVRWYLDNEGRWDARRPGYSGERLGTAAVDP